MALHEIEGSPGPPWDRPLEGTFDRLVVESELLADNPLGDSPRRPLYVYRPPGAEPGRSGDGIPSVYLLQGWGAQVDEWLGRAAFAPTMAERIDAMFTAGSCPDAIIVFVDAWTSLGGSQFLNSTGTGRYMDYLCDEVVPFIDQHYPTLATREHRGIAGKSSGGYGAMVVAMLRPDVFGALASHAGDALFECCYQPEFPAIARTLRDHFDGSYDVLRAAVAGADHFDWSRFGAPFSFYAYAAAYSPDPERRGQVLLPFEIGTGKLVDDVWATWLERDPVRMAARHADALAGLRRIYLDAGRRDEWFLDLGAQAFAQELEKLGIDHSLELFDGTHGGFSHRYPGAVRELVVALSPQ